MQKIPAFKYLLFLSGGFIFGIFIKLDFNSAVFLLTFALIITLLALKFEKLRMFYPLIVILSGILLFQTIHISQFKYPDKIVPEFRAVIKGKILSVQSARNNSMRVLFKGDFDPDIFAKMKNIKLLLNIYGKQTGRMKLEEGDIIRANVWVKMPQKSNIPGEFDQRQYALSSGFQFYAKTNASEVGIIQRAAGFDAFINSIRSNLKSRIDILFDTGNSGIIKALLTGDKSQIDSATKRTFAHTGTAHVLAISGLHIGIISSIILLLLSFVPSRIIRFSFFTVLLTLFIILTGSHPSSVRAGLMAVLIYLAWIAQRKINLLNILSLAIIIILFVDPQMIYSLGFQMSVFALLGIVLLFEPVKKFFDSIIKSQNYFINFIKISLTLTFAVSITVSPIVAYYFGYYSYISPLANLFVVPLITLVLIFAILSLAFSYIFIPFAYYFAADTDFLLDIIKSINSFLVQAGVFMHDKIFVLIFSIALSLALLYIFKSEAKRQIVFRTLVAGISLFLIFLVFQPKDKKSIKIFPRDNIVLVQVTNPAKNIFLILDRKKQTYIPNDYAVFKYISSLRRPSKLVYTGSGGKKIAEMLMRNNKINIEEIDLIQTEILLKRLNLNNTIYQQIEL